MTVTVRPRTCATCSRPARYLARGHCSSCYNRRWRRGAHTDLPTVRNPFTRRTEVVEDYLFMRAAGQDRTAIAERLGMTRKTLNRALERAASAGDTRIDYEPRKASA